jgi:hypothetical protein
MKHPSEADLALHAGGDLSLWRGLQVAWHVRHCPDCGEVVKDYRDETSLICRTAAELPDELEWNNLASEMRANIQVGLEAAECVAPVPAPRTPRLSWGMAAALATVTVLIVSGFWLHFPRPGTMAPEGVILSATSEGLELMDEDRALTLMSDSSQPVLLSVSVDGAMSEHYVDDETGMVTINNVYVQ